GPRLLPSTSALNRRPARLPTNPFDVVTSEGDTNFLDFVLLRQLVRLKLSYSDLIREKHPRNFDAELCHALAHKRGLSTRISAPSSWDLYAWRETPYESILQRASG